MKSWTVVGYQYQADTYCPDCIPIRTAPIAGLTRQDYESVEAYLDRVAGAEGLDRHNELGFDSWVFPKVMFSDQVEGNLCGTCHLPLSNH